ncbi:hypothetical protein BC938DRAFT_472411 [Jimgerdemannia flammicorona]|uniref:Calponin-homology (CH) domain-containing protein n=1 Tax=Jimgerdemannia flammicorona TaxID=994334 RepID=A0A433Q669_9FUNG|nr:hypothetical protein BC938DRAFT_472411 [Jimgerdemannia flammicorona]
MSYSRAHQPSAASQAPQEEAAPMMDRTWEFVQQKTFTKWFNTKLDAHNIKPIQNLEADISDGVRLIQLLEIIGDTTLGKYTKNPKMRIQKLENVSKALDFIKHRGVPLTNIGAEDIVDNNLKLILGMIWTIILRFTIADISQEGLTAKEGLLLWCQRKTAPYPEVNVRDFTYSWTDGLAFCALIHRHRPDLLDFDSLDKTDRHGNTALAFEVAERHLGITKLLDVEDVCDISKPDERSVMTYVAEYFHAFSALDKVETAGRRVAKFAEVMNSVWEMQHDYERRVLGSGNARASTVRTRMPSARHPSSSRTRTRTNVLGSPRSATSTLCSVTSRRSLRRTIWPRTQRPWGSRLRWGFGLVARRKWGGDVWASFVVSSLVWSFDLFFVGPRWVFRI